jgi:glycosyltransferase involved in cell wall biosynthesis
MPDLSVIIPSYRDSVLNKTVQDLLNKSKGDIEIIVVLDGYWAEVVGDDRVKVLHLGANRGMRRAINAGVSIATGTYLMRTDEHCMFGDGYDVIMCSNIASDWIVTPRRYFLDPVKWEVMDLPPVDYEKLVIDKVHNKFAGVTWKERTIERADIAIDETMAMQGSCWVMSRHHWDNVIGELDSTGYGTHYQDSHEMVFKTWKVGGKLMVNKNTWYAHKHRDFPRTHNVSGEASRASFDYSLNLWVDYYQEVKALWRI